MPSRGWVVPLICSPKIEASSQSTWLKARSQLDKRARNVPIILVKSRCARCGRLAVGSLAAFSECLTSLDP